MTNIYRNLSLFAALLFAVFAAPAQTIITNTTLSAAIGDSATQVMTVASATGFTANTTVAYIDGELVGVKSVNSTTIGIIRGQGGSNGAPHASGAVVFVGPPSAFSVANDTAPFGSCKRSNIVYLPYINVRNGIISDCVGGQWVQGIKTPEPPFIEQFPPTGGTAYTSLNSNGTTAGATTLYCTEVNLPRNKLLTGIALLNGTTVTTDNRYVVLYDSTGNALANSALAGVLTATASVYQKHAFTTKFYAVGPAQYFACFQTNTGTDSTRMVVTGTQDTLLTKGQTGATFGTIPTLTVPTTFTTAVGPYVYIY